MTKICIEKNIFYKKLCVDRFFISAHRKGPKNVFLSYFLCKIQSVYILSLDIDKLTFKDGNRIAVHCVSISASIGICIWFRKLKKNVSDKQVI